MVLTWFLSSPSIVTLWDAFWTRAMRSTLPQSTHFSTKTRCQRQTTRTSSSIGQPLTVLWEPTKCQPSIPWSTTSSSIKTTSSVHSCSRATLPSCSRRDLSYLNWSKRMCSGSSSTLTNGLPHMLMRKPTTGLTMDPFSISGRSTEIYFMRRSSKTS